MSKGLLKRVIAECSDEGSRSNITTALYCEIAEYLEMPEPAEPVAYEYTSTCGNRFVKHTPPQYARNIRPLYTTPPDQSARIAELELALARANAEIESLEDRLIVKNQRLYGCNEKLAALQAREPMLLDDADIDDMCDSKAGENGCSYDFARAIEQAVLRNNGFKVEE